MTAIVKSDFCTMPVDPLDTAHPALALWLDPTEGLLTRIRASMQRQGAHPARALVLLPYAQLMPLANRLWARFSPTGFSPAFETTQNWCSRMHPNLAYGSDIRFDLALDYLTAGALLRAGGLTEQAQSLSSMLVATAQQLAPLAAGVHPEQRIEWGAQAQRTVLLSLDSALLATEAALVSIAITWVAQSVYASDCLFESGVLDDLDCLFFVEGFTPEPLVGALQTLWGDKVSCLSLLGADNTIANCASSHPAWHAALDAEDEAQQSAACVLAHIANGQFPVALASSDRTLTRRIRSTLDDAGISIRDENGWKLSTSADAARVIALLKAAVWNVSSDAVLAWLKQAPVFDPSLGTLEMALRRDQARDWNQVGFGSAVRAAPRALALIAKVNGMREALRGSRTLADWQQVLRMALQTCGMWETLCQPGTGESVLQVLRLDGAHLAEWARCVGQSLWGQRRMDLAEFTAWVDQALEGARFTPVYPECEQVVILPMSQMLGRPFAAVVLAGCDEVRLNPAPDPGDGWSSQQRAALGLASRDAIQGATRLAWEQALRTPFCDVVWRCSDEAGEALLPSPLVQSAQWSLGSPQMAADPRPLREVPIAATLQPQPSGALLMPDALSASAYDDLRTCPYRYFAMRLLGLQQVDELAADIDKRDFGIWLHAVLSRFHLADREQADFTLEARRDLLDGCSTSITQEMGFTDAEFLPFAAAWPAVRDGYLEWQIRHEQTGAQFSEAELSCTQALGRLRLVGRIDRVDQLSGGGLQVLDYKTESAARSALRVKEPFEDTQMGFYAALLAHDQVQGAYVSVGERDGTRDYQQAAIIDARDAMILGIGHDMDRMAQGMALRPLGEGAACEFCKARGLCRKDMWSSTPVELQPGKTHG